MGGVVLLCNTAKLRKNYVTFLETDNEFHIVLHSFINVCLKVKYRTGGKATLNKKCTLYCSWIARDNVRIRNINFCAEIKLYMAFFETYWESYTFIIYKDNINVLIFCSYSSKKRFLKQKTNVRWRFFVNKWLWWISQQGIS